MCARLLKVLNTLEAYTYLGNRQQYKSYQKPHGLQRQKPNMFAMRFLVSLKSFIYSIKYCYYWRWIVRKNILGCGFLGF